MFQKDFRLHVAAERARIMQQIKALRAVLPNNQKTDIVSVLGEAIEYLKFLQSQFSCMQHPQLGPGEALGEPISLGTHQGPCSVNGCPGMGCYSSVPLLHPSTAHHYLSRASTLPCEFCSVLADAWAWPQHSLVPD
ncbi:Transcription factor SPATULA [Nymphaea thermarum]|nr:Transcription factor SPATULA [Nymphaea thermarum]